MERQFLSAALDGLPKCHESNEDGGASSLLPLLESVAGPVPKGASILDFGCGIGKCVRILIDRGYDAYGVDVYEYWAKDSDLYWKSTTEPMPDRVTERLRVATLTPYTLPFADAAFDHIVSTQVLEHVDDLEAVFAEIARTLKPGGSSVHIFPGRWGPPIESHIGVPLPVFCKYDSYLKAMAFLGVRSPRQRGAAWRDVYRSNREQMKIAHYPPRREILRKARKAGLEARFVHDRANARPVVTRLARRLDAVGLGALGNRLVSMSQQPRLLLRPLGRS